MLRRNFLAARPIGKKSVASLKCITLAPTALGISHLCPSSVNENSPSNKSRNRWIPMLSMFCSCLLLDPFELFLQLWVLCTQHGFINFFMPTNRHKKSSLRHWLLGLFVQDINSEFPKASRKTPQTELQQTATHRLSVWEIKDTNHIALNFIHRILMECCSV